MFLQPVVNSTLSAEHIDPHWDKVQLLINGNASSASLIRDFSKYSRPLTLVGTNAVASGRFGDSYENAVSTNPTTGSWLQVDAGNIPSFGTGDFTVECWVNHYDDTITTDSRSILTTRNDSYSTDFAIVFFMEAGGNTLSCYVGATTLVAQVATNVTDWYHLALVRRSGVAYFYVNGVLAGSVAHTTDYTSSLQWRFGSHHAQLTSPTDFRSYRGRFDDIRITTMSRYAADFGGALAGSPEYLVAGDSIYATTNAVAQNAGANEFIDSSSVGASLSATSSNPEWAQGTLNPYYQTWSIRCDGVDDGLSVASNPSLAAGSGDFTAECWFFPNGSAVNYRMIFGGDDVGTGGRIRLFHYGNKVQWFYNQSGAIILESVDITPNKWHHVAATREGSTIRLFVDGVLQASATDSSVYAASAVTVGRTPGGLYPFDGMISNVRYVIGSALYIAGFVPPSEALTAVSGTQLLLAAGNRFYDKSPNSHVVSVLGAPYISRFTPYPKEDSGNIDCGSLHIRGVDYTAGVNLGNLSLGSNNFTIEFWYNLDSLTTSGGTAVNIPLLNNFDWFNGATNGGIQFRYNHSTTSVQAIIYTGGSSNSTTAPTTTHTVALSQPIIGQWTHFALVREGGSSRFYVNGVLASTQTLTSNTALNYNTRPFHLGKWYNITIANNPPASSNYGRGYFADVRVVNGTAVYTDSFTPPTAPLADATNTIRLLKFTNGRVYDQYGSVNYFLNGVTVSNSVLKNGQPTITQTGNNNLFRPSGSLDTYDLFNFGTGDFTIEFWARRTGTNASYEMMLWDSRGTNPDSEIALSVSNTVFTISFVVNGSSVITSSATLGLNEWHHVALTRSGSTSRLFVDGELQGSYTDTNAYTNLPTLFHRYATIGSQRSAFIGNIHSVKVFRGEAKYTANFIATTTKPGILTRQLPMSGAPRYRHLNLQFEGSNGATTTTDSSSYANSVTLLGATIATAQFYSGTSSLYQSSYDARYVATTTEPIGKGDFTISGYFRRTSDGTGYAQMIAICYPVWPAPTFDSYDLGVSLHPGTPYRLRMYYRDTAGSIVFVEDPGTISLNTWYSWAVSRKNGSLYLYRNGALVGTGSSTYEYGAWTVSSALSAQISGPNYRALIGYHDSVVLEKGIARFVPDA